MTCEDCESIQRIVHQNVGYHEPTYFIWVGAANVEILACRVHATVLINAIQSIQAEVATQ